MGSRASSRAARRCQRPACKRRQTTSAPGGHADLVLLHRPRRPAVGQAVAINPCHHRAPGCRRLGAGRAPRRRPRRVGGQRLRWRQALPRLHQLLAPQHCRLEDGAVSHPLRRRSRDQLHAAGSGICGRRSRGRRPGRRRRSRAPAAAPSKRLLQPAPPPCRGVVQKDAHPLAHRKASRGVDLRAGRAHQQQATVGGCDAGRAGGARMPVLPLLLLQSWRCPSALPSLAGKPAHRDAGGALRHGPVHPRQAAGAGAALLDAALEGDEGAAKGPGRGDGACSSREAGGRAGVHASEPPAEPPVALPPCAHSRCAPAAPTAVQHCRRCPLRSAPSGSWVQVPSYTSLREWGM